jgi:hypothetical protein
MPKKLISALDFKDGMPSKATLATVYDNLDFVRAFDAFVNTVRSKRSSTKRGSRARSRWSGRTFLFPR